MYVTSCRKSARTRSSTKSQRRSIALSSKVASRKTTSLKTTMGLATSIMGSKRTGTGVTAEVKMAVTLREVSLRFSCSVLLFAGIRVLHGACSPRR